MGCASSIQVIEKPKQEKFLPIIKSELYDNTSDYSSLGNLNSIIDEDVRRVSVLTVKSGNLKFNEMSENDSPVTVMRKMSTIMPAKMTTATARPTNIAIGMDSPLILNKRDEKYPTLLHRQRLGNRSNFLSPTSKGLAPLSLPASPLVRLKERPEPELNERNSVTELRNSIESNMDATQALLNKALKELSKSLSDSHNSIFHIDSDDVNSPSTPRVSKSSLLTSHNLNRVSTSSGEQLSNVVVMDIGSGYCKAGLSGDHVPSVVIPTIVGHPNNPNALPGVTMDTLFVGNDVKLRHDALNYSRPVQKGIVQSWEEWQSVVGYILNLELKLDQEDISMVLPESSLSTRSSREKTAEIIFESLQLSRLYQGSSAPMALHAFGLTSGLLVSLGHEITSCVPVIQGNVKLSSVRNLELGGFDITNKLRELLEDRGRIKTGKDDSIAKAMMERLCYVTSGTNPDDDRALGRTQKTYSLPTGEAVSLDKERFLAAEILFQPPNMKDTNKRKGLHELCRESIDACHDEMNNDIINDLYKNIVLVGGTSLLPGLPQRLKKELHTLKPDLPESSISVHAFPKRQYAVWRGSSLMTSLHSSRGRWMTKADFEEHGSSIVHRKFV